MRVGPDPVPPRPELSAARRASPNHGPRRGAVVDMVVLHYTVLGAEEALDRLCDPEAEVSCHWVIDEAGTPTALVDEGRRAWHAGRSRWGEVRDVNSRSVGIELVNDGAADFPDPQMAALEALLAGVMARHAVPLERVLGHSDVAPGRKGDPGPRFDWGRLAARGLAVRSGEAAEADPATLAASLDAIGYDPEAPPDARLAAFRLRFRPGAAPGPADATDAGLARAVAARWPVAR